MSLSFYFLEDYKPEEGDPLWVFGAWERRGWMEDLKFLTKLERLEIPWVVILGFTPDFPNKKLRDVLPNNIRELCLREDLVTLPDDIYFSYRWKHFHGTMTKPYIITDCGPVIEQLEDYFFSGQGKSLRRLVMKYGIRRRERYSLPTERLCQILHELSVDGRVHIRLEDGTDTVEDLLMHSGESTHTKEIRFKERPKSLEVDYF